MAVRGGRFARVLAMLGTVGCGGGPPGKIPIAQPARVTHVARFQIAAPGVTGLSDLTSAAGGQFWTVAERSHVLLRIDQTGRVIARVPITDFPSELDVEGMAVLADGRLALATESDQPNRTGDAVFIGSVTPAGFVPEQRIDFDYAMWPLEPLRNQGIEGLCRSGDRLIAGIETVGTDGSRRMAPIAVYDMSTSTLSTHWVELTTRTGKLSALSCRGESDFTDVMAIERHFEVARLIRFRIDHRVRAGLHRPVKPVVAADLGSLLIQSENFEGLVWQGDRIWLIVDNDWTHVTGPNLLIRGRLSGKIPAPR